MDNEVKISVIIPVYNVEKYLDECMQSVLAQTAVPAEFILVDDGSKDNSGLMCDEYRKQDLRVTVIHKPNGGLGSARNAGVSTAHGKYICYLDSDDYLSANALERMHSVAEEYQLDMLLFAADAFFDGIEPDDKRKNHYIRRDHLNIVMSGRDALRYALASGEAYSTSWLRLYRKTFLDQNAICFNEEVIHEDIDYSFFTYMKAERVMNIPDRLYQRRYRPASIMTSTRLDRSVQGCIYAYDRVMDYLKNHEEDKEIGMRFSELLLSSCLGHYSIASTEERDRILKLISPVLETAKRYSADYRRIIRLGIRHPEVYRILRLMKKTRK